MKGRTEQSLAERVNIQSSFVSTCNPSDNCTCRKYLHRAFGHHLAMVLLLLIFIGLGLGTATTQAQTRAYFTNSGSNTVSVIDTATNTVVATIPIVDTFRGDSTNPLGIAITPDGTRAYVTNFGGDGGNSVSVIDTATNTVVALIRMLGEGPSGVAITPDGTRAYVTDNGNGVVEVIDTATNTVVALIDASASSSEKQRGVQAWGIFEVRSACRTFQESRAVRQLRRASLASFYW